MVLTEDTDRLYRMTRLPQFLSLSPRIEYLHLELWDYQSLGIIYEIVPLTPCLITLEITSRQSYLHLDTVLGILTQDPPWKCTLPKLQHLKLDVLTIPKVGGPPLIDTEQLLQMLESRCMPNSIPDRLGDASRPAPAVLKSCDINQRRFRAEPLVNLNQKLWGAQCKQRLEVFRERGVALGGNVLASLLDGYPIGRAPPLALNKYSILSHLTDG
ncbi:hypothetical protein BJ138DRAFT_231463 [Hygrophoropsis aurantiaca]|uniref:Uncharacterized protein n=1 Tax=Hygrophoropsis aurantiaca TaxID=72124 RepID=A0ACB7ZQ42_9AGAM|nr:hypothetical protein BJ138DRAFT_231463 [Hygrophoropsis aurantiaca]